MDLKREHANLDRLEATHVDVTRLRECVNTLVDIKIGKAEVRTAYAAVSTTAIALAASGAGLPGTLATSAAALAVEARKMAVRYQSTAEVMEATMALHAAANAEQTAAGAYDPDAPATRIVTSLLKRNTLPGRMLGAYDVPAIIADKRGWNVLMSKAMNL